MSKAVQIKVVERPHPNLQKLARALILLVEQQRSEQSDQASQKKAS